MHINRDASIAFPIPLHPLLKAVAIASRKTMKRIRDSSEAAHYERVISKLAPHLKYDIGDVDYIPPPPLPLREIQCSFQQSLEATRLRYF
jgi:hypothetical protein